MYARVVEGDGSIQQLFKYVDLNSFLRNLTGQRSTAALVVWLVLAGIAVGGLGAAWARSPLSDKPAADLLWAATIAWTLVFNLYVPIYDTILIVLSVILTMGVLEGSKSERFTSGERHHAILLLFGLYAVAFVSRYLTPFIRVQAITLVLGYWGLLALRFWRRTATAPHHLTVRQPLDNRA